MASIYFAERDEDGALVVPENDPPEREGGGQEVSYKEACFHVWRAAGVPESDLERLYREREGGGVP